MEEKKDSENKLLEQVQDEVINSPSKRKRKTTNIPVLSYEESLLLANAIWEYASGQKIRRLTLFDSLGKSPDSGPSRTLVTTSSKYGLTTGSYQAEFIELTTAGAIATDPDGESIGKLRANFQLAITYNEYFNSLYENYKDMKLPATSVMIDFLVDKGLDKQESKKCIELFLNNARYIGLIKLLAGSERILTLEYLIDELPNDNISESTIDTHTPITVSSNVQTHIISPTGNNSDPWENTCFYITPIGNDDSVERKHADLFLSSIVEPALEEFNLKVVRADKISNPGMITSQIIEHIHKSKLVIVDLSFNNPNVYYELSFRHSFNLPTIHLIRKQDKIPFDLHDFRTIIIDTTDIYTLVPQLESYRTEISRQARALLENPEIMENPISAYLQKVKKK